jgi:hypothetical protein
MDYDKTKDNVYVGIEDVRLLSSPDTNKCLYSGNRGLDRGNMLVEIGTVDISTKQTTSGFITLAKNQSEVEKNWVLVQDAAASSPKMVYNWPLTVGNIKPICNGSPIDPILPASGDCLFIPVGGDPARATATTPEIFKHLRGSANGIRVGSEIWFITHLVSYEDRRFYYHMIVVIDAQTYDVIRYTKLFTFEGSPVEYCLGFILVGGEDFLFGYSILDRETKYITLSKSYIEYHLMYRAGGSGGSAPAAAQ